jgi:hypothetical protein
MLSGPVRVENDLLSNLRSTGWASFESIQRSINFIFRFVFRSIVRRDYVLRGGLGSFNLQCVEGINSTCPFRRE